MEIFIKKLNSDAQFPTQATESDAGYDLASARDFDLSPSGRLVVSTGLSIAIPQGFYGRIAPRSGLAVKKGIDVLAGVVDSGYRGEIGVVLINFSSDTHSFKKGEKIAQLIIEKCHDVDWVETDSLPESERGGEGYGSTGDEGNLNQKRRVEIDPNQFFGTP